MTDNLTNSAPQFSTAEYAAPSGSDRCKACNQTLGSQYYRVNGSLTCPYCAEQTKLRLPQDTHQLFVRGIAFGIGGATLGLILYSAVGIITGLMIGYVSLAVGFIVGKAIIKGSNGIGGRRYQIASLVLTYAAVSMAAIPIGISQIVKEKKQQQGLVRHSEPVTSANPTESSTGEPTAKQGAPSQKPKMGLGAALIALAVAGLASPFLELQDPIHGVLGLVILLVGIRIAWRITAGVKVDILGPFKSVPQPAKADAS